MTQPEYPGNSQYNKKPEPKKAPEKKVEAIVGEGQAKLRKRSLGRRMAETFTGDDMQSVGQYLLFEVLLPAAKTMISDAASQGVDRLLFGGSRPGKSNQNYRGGYISYNKAGSPPQQQAPQMSRASRASHDFSDVLLPDRGTAQKVVDRLHDLIDQYQAATVADLYDLVGVTSEFTDNKWGWNDIRGAEVRRVSGGYMLILPQPIAID